MGNPRKIFVISILTIILIFLQPVSGSAQVDTVFFPALKTTTAEIPADKNNNLFIESEPYFNEFNHQFMPRSSVDHWDYNGQNRLFRGLYSEGAPIAPGHPFLLQFNNNTNDQTVLDFRTSYYSLLEGEGEKIGEDSPKTNTPRNILLQNGQTYGFIIDVEKPRPIFLKIQTDSISSGTSYTMNVRIIDGEGTVVSSNFGLAHHIEDLIPLVPKMAGEHYVFIRTFSTVILSQISIVNEPIIDVTPNGLSEHLTGDETIGKFIRIDTDLEPKIYNIEALLTSNFYLGGLAYLGFVSFRLFSPTASIIGSSFSSTTLVTSGPIYISIVALPPDESDPAVSGAKSDANLPEGMDLEYTVVVEKISIPVLPLGTDFYTFNTQLYSSSTGAYRVTFGTDVLLAMNATNFQSATLVSTDPKEPTIFMSTSLNDVFNSNGNFKVIPQGTYTVFLSHGAKIRFNSFDATDLAVDQNMPLSLAEGSFKLYRLPSDFWRQNLVNVTFTTMNNQTSLLNIWGFQANGALSFTAMSNFSHYYNTASNLVQNNFTNFITPQDSGDYFVLLQHVQSWRYLANGTFSTNFTTNAMMDIDISRQDYQSFLNEGSNNTNFFSGTLVDEYSMDNEDNTPSVSGILHIDVEENTAYRLVIDTLNVTIAAALLYYDYNSIWFSSSQNTPTLINNQTHYILEFIFATTEALTMSLTYLLGTPIGFSQLLVTLETIAIFQLDPLALGVLSVTGDGQIVETPLFQRPTTYLAIAVVAVVAFFAFQRYRRT